MSDPSPTAPGVGLEACPFCGGANLSVLIDGGQSCVMCYDCKAYGPLSAEEYKAAWNRRSQSAAVVVGARTISDDATIEQYRAGLNLGTLTPVDQMAFDNVLHDYFALRAQPGGEGFDMRDDWISAPEIDQYIEEMADAYEFRGDGGDYTPNDQERMLLIDFAHGFMADDMLLAMLRSHFDPNTRGYQKPTAAPTRVDVASGIDVANALANGDSK
jgi:hypothetical protein